MQYIVELRRLKWDEGEKMVYNQPEKYITNDEAKEAYNYLPEDVKIPKSNPMDETPLKDRLFMIKLFLPGTRWTWYIIEIEEDNNTCFGYVKSGLDPNFDEAGYFTIKQLEEIRSPLFDLPVERDIHWTPKKGVEVGVEW